MLADTLTFKRLLTFNMAGYDTQMQTNHLSHFLLTKELFPLLTVAANSKGEARIVNHSSGFRSTPSTPLQAKYLGKNGGNLGGNGTSALFGGGRWQRYHQVRWQQRDVACPVFSRHLSWWICQMRGPNVAASRCPFK